MTAGRTAVGARKAALAKGRRKRVVFIVGGLRVCGQRCARAGVPIAADERGRAELTHWRSVCGPGRCAVMELRVEVDGRGEPKALAELPCITERAATSCDFLANPQSPQLQIPTFSLNANKNVVTVLTVEVLSQAGLQFHVVIHARVFMALICCLRLSVTPHPT